MNHVSIRQFAEELQQVFRAGDPDSGEKAAESAHVRRVREFYAAVAACDYEAAAGCLADDIVMELVNGPSLRSVMEDHHLGTERALEIACQVSEALGAAHRIGITHRDVKPENIIITKDHDGHDFGLPDHQQHGHRRG